MTAPKGATEILRERGKLDWVASALAARAAEHAEGDQEEVKHQVLNRSKRLLDDWEKIAKEYQDNGVQLQYQQEEGAARPLLYSFLDPELKKLSGRQQKFRANRSMRDVEPSVNLWLKTMDGIEIESQEDEQ